MMDSQDGDMVKGTLIVLGIVVAMTCVPTHLGKDLAAHVVFGSVIGAAIVLAIGYFARALK
jgi:uncharacterized membrane protein YeaQ/YmgE (transglycosylase-associated protein family)